MGVRGLEKFMHIESLAPVIDLTTLFEGRTREGECVIAVHGQSFVDRIFGSVDWYCGGQLKQYGEEIEKFVNEFTKLGVKLVFFFSTHLTIEAGRRNWLKWRHDTVHKVEIIYDQISKNGTPPPGDEFFYRPQAALELASYFLKKMGCEVYKEAKGPHDANVAKYAQQHKCFAVLGQDSDLIFYEGIEYYLSTKYLDLKKMTTVNYSRSALAGYLGLEERLLPLLAPLLGNDEVPEDLVYQFHRGFGKPQGGAKRIYIIKRVANFLQHLGEGMSIMELVPVLCERVFNSTYRLPRFYYVLDRYCVSTEQPDNTNPPQDPGVWGRIQQESENLMRADEMHPSIYGVLHGRAVELRASLEDFRKTSIPPVVLLFRPLRRRLYGLLLREKPPAEGAGDRQPPAVGEWCFESQEKPKKPVLVSPEAVPDEPELHPGLLALWDAGDRSEEMLQARWQLLAWAVSPSGRMDAARLARVRALPPSLVAPTLLLHYLYQEPAQRFLEAWEVCTFIAQAVILPGKEIADLSGIQIQRHNVRAIQLANVFMEGCFHMRLLVEACGCPIQQDDVFPVHYFDGKLFHSMYVDVAESVGLGCPQAWKELELFNLMGRIIFD